MENIVTGKLINHLFNKSIKNIGVDTITEHFREMFIYSLLNGYFVLTYIPDKENLNTKFITNQLKAELKKFYPEFREDGNEYNQLLKVTKRGFVYGLKMLIDDPELREVSLMTRQKALKHLVLAGIPTNEKNIQQYIKEQEQHPGASQSDLKMQNEFPLSYKVMQEIKDGCKPHVEV